MKSRDRIERLFAALRLKKVVGAQPPNRAAQLFVDSVEIERVTSLEPFNPLGELR